MRLSSIILSITSLMAFSAVANPTGGESEMENIEKRGCNTGNWCCTESYPSAYCARYCAAGSIYIDCSGSNVSIWCLRENSRQVLCIMILTLLIVPGQRPVPVPLPLSVGMATYLAIIQGVRGRYLWDVKGLNIEMLSIASLCVFHESRLGHVERTN